MASSSVSLHVLQESDNKNDGNNLLGKDNKFSDEKMIDLDEDDSADE